MSNIYISSCCEDGGIYRYSLENGKLIFKDKTSLDRPMYTAINNGKMYVILRAPFEDNNSGIISLEVSADGKLTNPTKPITTQGVVACHLCVTNGEVYSANYLSGSVTKLGKKTVVHSGSGPNLPRQDMAHCHFTGLSPDNKYVLVCDLGLDTIFTYDMDLNEVSRGKVPNGHGVRHLAFSEDKKTLYAVNELASTVSVFDYNDGVLTLIDTVAGLPEDFSEKSTAAAIRVYGNRLYVSNRGHDSVAVFDISEKVPKIIKWVDVCGKSPRDFDIIDGYLICTNEGGNITVFKMEDDIFTLTDNISCKDVLCVDKI